MKKRGSGAGDALSGKREMNEEIVAGSWPQFIDDFSVKRKEFKFWHWNFELHISCLMNNFVSITYGKPHNYLVKTYDSPQDFLKDPLFCGKTLQGIWDNLVLC